MKKSIQFLIILALSICLSPKVSLAQTVISDSILRNTLIQFPIADSDAMYILSVTNDRSTESALSTAHKTGAAAGRVIDTVKVYGNELVSTYAILGQQPYGESRYVLARLEPIILALLPLYPPEITAAILLIKARNQQPYSDGRLRGISKANGMNTANANNR